MSIEEPPHHLDDTSPTRSIRGETLPAWRRLVGLICLLGAAALTIASAFLLLMPASTPEDTALPAPTQTDEPTQVVAEVPSETPFAITVPTDLLPTLSPDQIDALLNSPVNQAESGGSFQVVRNNYDPFTLIPDRPRRNVIQYTVVKGDTVFSIAERFGLQPETIAWSNDRRVILGLRPGQTLNILPVDGVYHTVIGSKTIAEIAASYGITDPYVVIDSPYNQLFGVSPDTVLPSGEQIVIPGGEAEQISWNPTVEREGGESTSGGNFVNFAPGEAGSCGKVPNVSGTYWRNPMSSYTITRGFSSWHTGIDLAAPIGTPVMAANGGVVIFAGWNSWGYGNAIVLSHGPFSTLYGHLSAINVGCRQLVNAGQVIGAVGSTGNSSGPHLHFEIRYLDVPQNPTATIGF